MTPFDPDSEQPDMFARRAAGIRLISEDIALAIARLVFAREHGEEALEKQLPLSVVGDAYTWVVRGSAPVVACTDISKLVQSLEMRISQFNGQIFTNHFAFYLPRSTR
jgi:hypothetical protein